MNVTRSNALVAYSDGPEETTSISLDRGDIEELLNHGFTHDKDAGVKLTLNEEAKEFLVTRDTGGGKEGQTNNDEVQVFVGKINHAWDRIAETARDYDRLARINTKTDPAAALEFTHKADGLREAIVHLSKILPEGFYVRNRQS